MKRLLSKEQFVNYLENVLKKEADADVLNFSLQNFTKDKEFTGFWYNYDFEIEFLEDLLDDENHWIGWWISEGREEPEKNYVVCDEKKWVIDSPEKLYDFLFQEGSEKPNEYYAGGKLALEVMDSYLKDIKDTGDDCGIPEVAVACAEVIKILKERLKKELTKKGVFLLENEQTKNHKGDKNAS